MRRAVLTILILGFLLIVAIFGGVAFGSERLGFFEILCALTGGSCGLSAEQTAILFDIRLPRILLGACIGAALALSGASYQSLLRNPLADPYLLGISNGAAVGTMLALVFFGGALWARPAFAFAGAALATLVVYNLARSRAGMNVERLILSGVIVTTFLSSAIALLTSLLDATRLRTFTFWLLGDLANASKDSLAVAFFAVAAGIFILLTQARALNLMMLGERDAFDFGVEVGRVRLIVFLTASVLVGASVAASGSVGYVGLVIPHLVRLSAGSDNRLVIPASALAGAAFVVVADTVARTAIAPRELPVGAITALIGAPLFIYLLRKN
jgi:iron complex transport system permease protein